MDVVNYKPLGAVYVDGFLIGEQGELDRTAKDFKYKPSVDEVEHCTRIYVDAMPKGRLWEAYGVNGTTNNAIAQGVGSMIATVLAYFEYVRKELNPYTTEDLIVEWEESVGLPDPCTIQHFQTLEERRQQVILRLKKTPVVTAKQMEGMVKTLTGFNVRVIPRRKSELFTGELDTGILDFELSNDKYDRFTFDVIVDYEDDAFLDTPIGEVLDGSALPRVIECVIERIKPANSLAIYHYQSSLYNQLTG
jgi:uncharacterized protein YmfQ (DUF2313 family)